MEDILTQRAGALVEGISKATQQQLSRTKIFPNDRLEISIDDSLRCFELRAFSEHMGHRGIASRAAAELWVKRVPEHHAHPDKMYGHWLVAATDFSALVIHFQWPRAQLVFEGNAEAMYDFLLLRFLREQDSSLVAAKYKINGILPTAPDGYFKHDELPLAAYQEVALFASAATDAFALFMEQGTGKTAVGVARICLEAARLAKAQGRMLFCLVVCPGQVRRNWENEVQRFATVPGRVGVLRGGLPDRIRCLVDTIRPDEKSLFATAIISYDSLETTMEAVSAVPWDLIIIDESHYIKNHGTRRWKALKALRECGKKRMALTGTPITNTPFDLWTQLEFLGEGMSGFNTFDNFRKFYGVFTRTTDHEARTSVEKLVDLKNLPLVQERLARLSFSITKKEAGLQLPEKVYNILEVEMSPKQAGYYNRLQKDLALKIEEQMAEAEASGRTVSAEHILTQLLRLSQITSGFVKFDNVTDFVSGETTEGQVCQISKDNAKVGVLLESIRESFEADPHCKKIVWTIFVEDMRVIAEKLAAEGIKFIGYHDTVPKEYRAKSVEAAADAFNTDDSIRVFLGNPSSAGAGLNLLGYDYWEDQPKLNGYTDQEYFFSCDWSAVKRSQAEDRAHRRGTRAESVLITDIVVPGTIDEEIRCRVVEKRTSAALIQDLSVILSSVLKG